MFDQLNLFEIGILDWIQNVFRCAFLDWFFPLVTKFGDHGVFWILIAAVLLCFKKTRATGCMMSLSLLCGLLIGNTVMKPLFARIRPYEANVTGEINLLVERLSDYSFPSGHTLASFEAAVVLMIRDRKLGIPALAIAVLVALSRLYLYVHYPTDVLVGMVLGTLFAFFSVWAVKLVWNRFSNKEPA